jgi:hypothetical protein
MHASKTQKEIWSDGGNTLVKRCDAHKLDGRGRDIESATAGKANCMKNKQEKIQKEHIVNGNLKTRENRERKVTSLAMTSI